MATISDSWYEYPTPTSNSTSTSDYSLRRQAELTEALNEHARRAREEAARQAYADNSVTQTIDYGTVPYITTEPNPETGGYTLSTGSTMAFTPDKTVLKEAIKEALMELLAEEGGFWGWQAFRKR